MASNLEVGTTLQAKYTDGAFYAAQVVQVSESSRRKKAPVKVHFIGYDEDDVWLPLDDLRSKRLPKTQATKPAATKAKAKAKAKAAPTVDVAKLEVGTKLEAQAMEDDRWYSASIVAVSQAKRRATAPVKVNYIGYTKASDEWLSVARLRGKALKSAVAKGAAKAEPSGPKKPAVPASPMKVVPILRRLVKHAAGLGKAVVQSSATSDPTTMTYKDLLASVEENSQIIVSLLAGRKEGLPKHVAYLLNPSCAYVVTELSIWAAGACCVPLSIHSPAPELEYFVEASEAALLLADASMTEKFRPVAAKLGRAFGTVTQSAAESGGSPKVVVVADEGVATGEGDANVTMATNSLILFTSGTTGKPKAAVHTFRSLSAQYASLSKAWKWSSKDYTLHVLPLHHIHGVQNILNTALYNGAGVEFAPFEAGFCMKRLCSGDVTCFHAVPTVYVKFTQHLEKLDADARAAICQGLRNESLRYMVSGSAALPMPTMKSWAEISGHVLLERYGMTEIGMALSNRINDTRFPGCVGWPLPSSRVKVGDDGAILIKGPCLFKEYYKNEEATKSEFTEDHWFKTGDNCAVGGSENELQQLQDDARDVEHATGRPREGTAEKAIPVLKKIYRILGRTSVDIIKSGGYKISALEIESVLLTHERIQECAVIGQEDETWGEKVTAVVVLKEGAELTIKELREWGKERLATYKVPQDMDIVKELPRNQMGKLEKKKLMEQYKK